VEKRRQITEEDVLLTELLLARSFGRLKHSVVQEPLRALSSAGGIAKKHPYATAAAAAGVGLVLFGLFRQMTGDHKKHGVGKKGHKSQSNMTMDIISMALPIVTPYLTGYLEKHLGTMFSKDRD
jgi:hypothetical protein